MDCADDRVILFLPKMRELMKRYQSLSKFYATLGKNWVLTAGAWGTGLGVVFLYVTDWKVVTQKIPFIKDKYDHEIPK